MAINSKVEATITAENQFTNWLKLNRLETIFIEITGTFTADIKMQYSFDGGATINDTKGAYTEAELQSTTPAPHSISYRIGVKTGDFTSGTINLRLSKD